VEMKYLMKIIQGPVEMFYENSGFLNNDLA
jgi:hypothetical protein